MNSVLKPHISLLLELLLRVPSLGPHRAWLKSLAWASLPMPCLLSPTLCGCFQERSLKSCGHLAVPGVLGHHSQAKPQETFPQRSSRLLLFGHLFLLWRNGFPQWSELTVGRFQTPQQNQNREEEKKLICGKLESKTLDISIDVTREKAMYVQERGKTPNKALWETSWSRVIIGDYLCSLSCSGEGTLLLVQLLAWGGLFVLKTFLAFLFRFLSVRLNTVQKSWTFTLWK